MKNRLYRLLFLSVMLLGMSSCAQQAGFYTTDFVTFTSATYSVKETAEELKVPVSLISKTLQTTTVGYEISTPSDLPSASDKTDYTIVGTGVLTISNDPKVPSDSIIVKPVSYEGKTQGHKYFTITLTTVGKGIEISGTSSCNVKIVDVDSGLNLLVGSWSSGNLATDIGEPSSMTWLISRVSGEEPALALYPEANIKIAMGSYDKISFKQELLAYFDDEESVILLYPFQAFFTAEFDGLGVANMCFAPETAMSGDTEPLTISFNQGELRFEEDVYVIVYKDLESGPSVAGYYDIMFEGGKLHKRE